MSRKLNLNKKFLLLLLLFPLVITFITFAFYYKSPINLLNKNDYKLFVYDDRNNKGNSIASLLSYDTNSITYQYSLHDSLLYPYAGLGFAAAPGTFLDLSSYDYLKLVLKAENGKRLPFTISTYVDNFSKKEDFLTHRLMRSVINTSSELEEHLVPLNTFSTPDWWFSLNQKSENEILVPDYSRTKYINLNQCIDIKDNVLDRIEVKEFSFHRDYQPFFLWSGLSLFLYYLGSLVLIIISKSKKQKGNPSIHFNYEKVEVENHFEKEEESVFNFLTTNYPKQDLSISDLQNELGLYEQKISSIIKKKTGLTFKQFLNKLRLSEAQRLLLNSDLRVSEIAFKVGYGNVSHFNRVFKEALNCSPNDFRKQQSLIQQ